MTRFEIGYVARAHGLAGELRLTLHWEGSEALGHVAEVRLTKGERSQDFRVQGSRGTNKAPILRLEGVADRTLAESWQGATVSVVRDELPALEPGEYYLADLVGARVAAPDGDVGVVVEVAVNPSVDSLVIRTPSGALVEQPLLDEWLLEVDSAAQLVRLRSREGLIE